MGRRLIFSLAIAPVAGAAVFLIFLISRTPDFKTVKSRFRASDRAILDRRGRLIDEVHFSKSARHLDWVDLSQTPPFFIEAVLVAQDRRFYFHPGFDLFALLRGSIADVDRSTDTLTMQVAAIVEKRSSAAPYWMRIGQALALELKWRKREILEAYVNLVPYREDLHGLSAASFAIFDKNPATLSHSESALLAALIGFSKTGLGLMHDRACGLLRRLGTPEECALLGPEHLSYLDQVYRIHPFRHLAPQVALRLAKDSELHDRSLIRSTLDRDLQWTVLHALQKHSVDAAAIVIENQSGNVIVDVEESEAHPAGSTLKPLLYAKALDERILTAATELEKSPSRPKRLVTVRAALVQSLNIPALRALDLLGVDSFVENLKALGLSDLQAPDRYGPSLALGAIPVRLREIANAYRAVANKGVWSPLRFSPELTLEETAHRVYSEATAFIVADILANRGAESPSRLWTALKTEDSEDGRDSLAVGFSEKYTVGVWIRREKAFKEANPARRLWLDFIKRLHIREPAIAPQAPATLVRGPARKEWFISGTEPSANVASAPSTRIAYPLDRSSLSLWKARGNPVFIQVVAPRPDQNLYLNGRRLGRAKSLMRWEPRAGRYRLELRDSQGRVIDRVLFDVRGRTFASAQ